MESSSRSVAKEEHIEMEDMKLPSINKSIEPGKIRSIKELIDDFICQEIQ